MTEPDQWAIDKLNDLQAAPKSSEDKVASSRMSRLLMFDKGLTVELEPPDHRSEERSVTQKATEILKDIGYYAVIGWVIYPVRNGDSRSGSPEGQMRWRRPVLSIYDICVV